MMNRPNHNAKIQRYRNQAGKYRLELMITPELRERFAALPELTDATHAQRLAALCALWERAHGSIETILTPETPEPAPISADQAHPLQGESPAPHPVDEPLAIGMLDLDELLNKVNALDAELAAEDAAEAPRENPVPTTSLPSFLDEPRPLVPPYPDAGNARYQAEKEALQGLYEREWPRRKHGNHEDAKRWKLILRQERPLLAAFRSLTFYKEQLADLIRHACLGLDPNDLLAWAELEEDDRRIILWYLLHAGTIYPDALGEAGQRFRAALERQPKRHILTWEIQS